MTSQTTTSFKLTILGEGATIKVVVSSETKKHIFEAMKRQDTALQILDLQQNEFFISPKNILAIKVANANSLHDGKRPKGVTIKEICKVAHKRWKYPTLVRRVNKQSHSNPIFLEMESERRVSLSAANIKKLELSQKEVAQLKEIEQLRIEND